VLTALPEFTPTALLDRYQLAQAQGLLYYATELLLQAHRNTSGEYKKLFRFLKFYGLGKVIWRVYPGRWSSSRGSWIPERC
jgi:predicted nuclease of restriction endonuclease-like RecB superfamily